MFLGRKGQHVLLRMYTERTLSETEDFSVTNVRPALSARDLRLAILLENHFQEKYVASRQALPLLPMTLRPNVPDRVSVSQAAAVKVRRAAPTVEGDTNWTPSALTISALPPLPDEDAETICTDAHFDVFLRPLYSRGWHATFLPVVGSDKFYAPTLCLTGFYRFASLTAAIAFIRDVAGRPWYKEDNVHSFCVHLSLIHADFFFARRRSCISSSTRRPFVRSWCIHTTMLH